MKIVFLVFYGTICESEYLNAKNIRICPFTHPINLLKLSYNEVEQMCQLYYENGRICTLEEYSTLLCATTRCGFDSYETWTSTTCKPVYKQYNTQTQVETCVDPSLTTNTKNNNKKKKKIIR